MVPVTCSGYIRPLQAKRVLSPSRVRKWLRRWRLSSAVGKVAEILPSKACPNLARPTEEPPVSLGAAPN